MDERVKTVGVVAGVGAAIGVGLALGLGLRVLAVATASGRRSARRAVGGQPAPMLH